MCWPSPHPLPRQLPQRRFPKLTKALGDRFRWTFRMRNDMGAEIRYRTALKLAQIQPRDVILEIGHLTYMGQRMAKAAQSVTVCNITGINRAAAAHGPSNLHQMVGDITLCEMPADHFDLCMIIAVFEHIEDDHAAAVNLFQSLKPGGRMVVYVPDTDEHLAFWEAGGNPDHVRPGYRVEGMRALLEGAGFQVDSCELVNGVYAAVAGYLYYDLLKRLPFLRVLPRFFVRPFMWLVERDDRRPGSLRWGLFAKATKPLDPEAQA